MIAVLLVASLGQTCVNGVCHKQVAVVQQQVVAQQVYAVQPLYAPQFVYSVGDSEKIEALTAIAANQAVIDEKLSRTIEQNQQIIQRLQAQPVTQSAESKLGIAAREILKRDCVSCHRPGKEEGGFDLTGIIKPELKMLIAEVADTGAMPPPKLAKELSNEDVATLKAWAEEDRVAVRAALRGAAKKVSNERVGGP